MTEGLFEKNLKKKIDNLKDVVNKTSMSFPWYSYGPVRDAKEEYDNARVWAIRAGVNIVRYDGEVNRILNESEELALV